MYKRQARRSVVGIEVVRINDFYIKIVQYPLKFIVAELLPRDSVKAIAYNIAYPAGFYAPYHILCLLYTS